MPFSLALLELLHGDLCGPISPATPSGKRYFMLIVDDCTRYMWIVLIRRKDEALLAFKLVQARSEHEIKLKVKELRTDRGGEFTSNEFTSYCDQQGLKRSTTTPYSAQQNGMVERRNQTVVGMSRSLLKSMKVPGRFWGEAASIAVYLLNHARTRSLTGTTPFEALYKRRPK